MKYFPYFIYTGVAVSLVFLACNYLEKYSTKRSKARAEKDRRSKDRLNDVWDFAMGGISWKKVISHLHEDDLHSFFASKLAVDFLINADSHQEFEKFLDCPESKHLTITETGLLNALIRGNEFYDSLRAKAKKEIKSRVDESLLLAAYKGDLRSVSRLVNEAMSGKDVGLQFTDRASLLWFALHSGNTDVVSEILRLGEDAVYQYKGHTSVVHLAAEISSPEIINLIFSTTVPRDVFTKEGKSYLDLLVGRDLPGDFILNYARIFKADGLNFVVSHHRDALKAKGILDEMEKIFPVKKDEPAVIEKTPPAPRSFVGLANIFKDILGQEKLQFRLEGEFSSWLSTEPKTRALLIWGTGGSGKSEIGLSLGGMKEGNRTVPGFRKSFYVTPATLGALPETLLTPEKCLVIIDDFHLIADKGQSFAYSEGFHKSFLVNLKTIMSTTNHFWIFLSGHSSPQGPAKDSVLEYFGDEIGWMVDFEDFGLKSPGLSDLVRFAFSEGLQNYLDDSAIAQLVSRIHSKRRGPRTISLLLQQLKARKESGTEKRLANEEINKLLDKIGA